MKRIISILLILTISITTVIAVADDSTIRPLDMSKYDEAYQLLTNLSVINDADALTYESTITRGRFAKIISDCLRRNVSIEGLSTNNSGFTDVDSSHKYYNEIYYLNTLGIISGNGSGMFRPDDSISFGEALHLMLVVLGYGDYIKYNGGYLNGDYAAARKASVDISLYSDNTCSAILPLVVECLESNILEVEQNSLKSYFITFKDNTNVSGLEFFFGLRKSRGILQSNGIESVMVGKDIVKNKIVIDGVAYSFNGELPSMYVGTLADYWYKVSDNDIKELFMIRQSQKNEILEIDATDIEGFTGMTYSYKTADSSKSRKIKITGKETIIYNSKPIVSFDKTLMIPKDGKIVFIDNDCDSEYNVIRIYSYESFVINSLSKNSDGTYIIYPKNTYGLSSYTTDVDISRVFNSSGKQTTFERIVLGSSVSVYSYEQEGKNVVYEAYVSDKKITGDLNLVFNDGNVTYLVINGEEMRVADTYKASAQKLKCDYNMTFYVDFYGNIAGLDGDSVTTMAYGYLLQKGYDNHNMKQVLQLKIFSQVGNVIIYDCAENVWIDNVKYTDAASIESRLEAADGLNNIIRYSVNAKKEINRIDLWENADYVVSDSDISDRLKLVNPVSELYLKKAYKNFGGQIKYDDSTMFFYLPTGTETIEDGIRLISSKDLSSDGYYEISAYTSNVDNIVPEVCLLKNLISKNSGYAESGIVTKVSETYDAESGETYKSLHIEEYNKQTVCLIKSNDVLKTLPGKTLKRGDIIKYTTNHDGFIESVTLLYRADGDTDVMSTSSVEAFTNGSRYAIGTVFYKDQKYIKIFFGTPLASVYPAASKMEAYNIENFKKIIIVDITTSKIDIETGGGINDISAYVTDSVGSKVILNTEFGEERMLYIIKK